MALRSADVMANNPQLPDRPTLDYTDAEYEAREAALRREKQGLLNQILRKLGYMDPETGQFVLGSVELEANRQRKQLGRDLGLAREGVTNEMREGGTLFSGYRGTATARAEHPFVSALADLDIDVPRMLAALLQEASGLSEDYSTQNALLLADLARRRKPGGDPGTEPGVSATPTSPGEPVPYAGGRSETFIPPAYRAKAVGLPPLWQTVSRRKMESSTPGKLRSLPRKRTGGGR